MIGVFSYVIPVITPIVDTSIIGLFYSGIPITTPMVELYIYLILLVLVHFPILVELLGLCLLVVLLTFFTHHIFPLWTHHVVEYPFFTQHTVLVGCC